MNLNQIVNLLATVTLIEMMLAIGLGVTVADILNVARDKRCVLRATLANYVFVPAVAMLLLYVVNPAPMVAIGILVSAVCPGAPYGPPFNAIAKGDVTKAVGLMVILAASSAILAPLLLVLFLSLLGGNEPVRLNVVSLVSTLVFSQFLPLAAGVFARARWKDAATKFKRLADRVCTLLNLALLALILVTQFRMFLNVRLIGYAGMVCLVGMSAILGWLFGGPGAINRKTLAITTGVRNVGVSLVIVTGSFPGSPAISSATAFAICQTIIMAIVALAWPRLSALRDRGIGARSPRDRIGGQVQPPPSAH